MNNRSIPDPDGIIVELKGYAKELQNQLKDADDKQKADINNRLDQIARIAKQIYDSKTDLESSIDMAEMLLKKRGSTMSKRALTIDELEAIGDYRTAQRIREVLVKKK